MDHRYQKRMSVYWSRDLKKELKAFDRLDTSSWFDLWHTHPDWKSKGNRFPENRAIVAKITYQLLIYAECLFQSRSQPVQIFASICEDTGNNAVYIHSENPNGTPFPYEFSDTVWDVPEPLELFGIVDNQIHQIGLQKFSNESVYVVRKREVS